MYVLLFVIDVQRSTVNIDQKLLYYICLCNIYNWRKYLMSVAWNIYSVRCSDPFPLINLLISFRYGAETLSKDGGRALGASISETLSC